VTLYPAASIITMDEGLGEVEMVAVAEGRVLAVGSEAELSGAYPAATRDETFADKTLVPGLIDPHVHMGLSSLQYATKLTPPWEMATPSGVVEGLPDRPAFLGAVRKLVAEHEGDGPLVAEHEGDGPLWLS